LGQVYWVIRTVQSTMAVTIKRYCFGIGFIVSKHTRSWIIDFMPLHMIRCVLRDKGRFQKSKVHFYCVFGPKASLKFDKKNFGRILVWVLGMKYLCHDDIHQPGDSSTSPVIPISK